MSNKDNKICESVATLYFTMLYPNRDPRNVLVQKKTNNLIRNQQKAKFVFNEKLKRTYNDR